MLAKSAQIEAFNARDDALAFSRQLKSKIEMMEVTLQRAHADIEAKSNALDDLESQITKIVLRAETAESLCEVTRHEKEASSKRSSDLERTVTRQRSDIESLKTERAAADVEKTEAVTRSLELEEILARVTGRVSALEHNVQHDSERCQRMERSLADERDARISAETEVVRLREELQRRPPLDVLKQLDIDGLMQKNLQAAAAMQSLLNFAQSSQPTQYTSAAITPVASTQVARTTVTAVATSSFSTGESVH
jgi:chromosome segregation ATPase